MGIIDAVKKIIQNRKEKSAKYKELEEDYLMQKKLEERQKSANKRELEKWQHEQEEANIKKALDKIHQKQTHDDWKSNMFKGKATVLNGGRQILKERNIFKGNKNMFLR